MTFFQFVIRVRVSVVLSNMMSFYVFFFLVILVEPDSGDVSTDMILIGNGNAFYPH